jgi:ComF family protein
MSFLDILNPSRCVLCNNPASYGDACLCPGCASAISIRDAGCGICSGTVKNGCCDFCSDRHLFFRKNISALNYEGRAREMIHQFKFNRRKRLYLHLAKAALGALDRSKIDADMITYVPMRRTKRWKRGFNQSELVAGFISRNTGLALASTLSECISYSDQKYLRSLERHINAIGRFRAVNKGKVAGSRIILVDDVFTTGATVNECSRILLNAGAKEIFSLTLARSEIKSLK